MSATTPAAGAEAAVRARCAGVVALAGRLEPWQLELCRRPERVAALLAEHGSPVNLIDPSPLGRNAAELRDAAARFGLELGILFARKANKALGLVDEALRLGLGIDLAGERELEQALQRGAPGSALVMTAAVKPASLLASCIDSGTTVVVDNGDEPRLLARLPGRVDRATPVALRVAPAPGAGRVPTRFGLARAEALALAAEHVCPARRRGCGSTACSFTSTATTRATGSQRSARRSRSPTRCVSAATPPAFWTSAAGSR